MLKSLTDEDVITFGKYRDQPLKDVPSSYLDWLIGQDWFLFNVRLYNYIQNNKAEIESDIDEDNLPY